MDNLELYSGIKGQINNFLGKNEKVWNAEGKHVVYYDKKKLAELLTNEANLSKDQINKINQKFLEIVHPFNDKLLTTEDLKKHFFVFHERTNNFDDCINRLEAIKQQTSPF